MEQLIINQSLNQGINQEIAQQQAKAIVALLGKPNASMEHQLLSDLCTALMFEGAEREQRIAEIILTFGPQILTSLDADKQSQLQSAMNELRS